MKRTIQLLLAALIAAHPVEADAKPLKVFILAGQSNMEGHARVETFDYIGDDPATAPLLKMMRGADGKPAVAEGAWISYLTGHYEGNANGEGVGKLTAGYGARGDKPTQDGGKIGPEFTFGLTMDAAFAEPVLIIKTAWGGRSLHTEFRPPSAGPYELNDYQKKLYYGPPGHGVPKDMDAWLAEKKKETGRFYRMMIEHVKMVLADPKRVVPGYDAAQGYEIAGLRVVSGLQRHGGRPHVSGARQAGALRQIQRMARAFHPRRAPRCGRAEDAVRHRRDGRRRTRMRVRTTQEFRKAMAAPAALPEFAGNVVAVETAPFWSAELDAIDKKRAKVSQMRHFLNSKHKDHANADGNNDRGAKARALEEVRSRPHLPRRRSAVETRCVERRLPLSRLREDLRANGGGVCRGHPINAEGGGQMSRQSTDLLRQESHAGFVEVTSR